MGREKRQVEHMSGRLGISMSCIEGKKSSRKAGTLLVPAHLAVKTTKKTKYGVQGKNNQLACVLWVVWVGWGLGQF